MLAGGDAAEAGYVEDASVGSGPLGPIPGTVLGKVMEHFECHHTALTR